MIFTVSGLQPLPIILVLEKKLFFLRNKNGGLYGYITPLDKAPVRVRQPGPILASAASTIVWGVNPTKDAHQWTPADNRTRT